jgi:GntR family transcriptional regulator
MEATGAPRSFVPAYYQIAVDLAEDIEQGRLSPGELIPSESQLCRRYGVSRMTVRQGLNLLAEAGYTYSVPGKGTFVAAPQLCRAVIDLGSATGRAERRLHPGIPLLNRVTARPETAARMGLAPGSEVLELRRTWHEDGRVMAFECKYVGPQASLSFQPKDLRSLPFPDFVARAAGRPFVKVTLTVDAAAADAEKAAWLEVPEGSPLLVVEETVATQGEAVLGWGRTFRRPGDHRLTAVCDPFWRRPRANGGPGDR